MGAYGFDGAGMWFRFGELLLLGRIILQIVEFLSTGPAGATPSSRANRLAEFFASSDDGVGGLLSCDAGITQHRDQTSALQIFGRSDITQLSERRKQVNKFNKSFAG